VPDPLLLLDQLLLEVLELTEVLLVLGHGSIVDLRCNPV
jgi:hypothetical protein